MVAMGMRDTDKAFVGLHLEAEELAPAWRGSSCSSNKGRCRYLWLLEDIRYLWEQGWGKN